MWNEDTPVFQVSGHGLDMLTAALHLAFGEKRTAKGWFENDERMALCWTDHPEMKRFPAELTMRECAPLMLAWLDRVVDHGNPLDHDGDSKKGWLLFTEGWGHVDPWGYHAFIAIRPKWQHYGK